MWSPEQRPVKYFQRQHLFRGLKPRYYYLTLPAGECEDIKAGIEEGVIQPSRTTITAVERDPDVYGVMCQWFVKNWKQRKRLICDELSSVKNLGPTDLAFLDYKGNPTMADAAWIRDSLAPILAHGACVGMTVTKTYRHNFFYPTTRDKLKKSFASYFRKTQIRIRDSGEYTTDMLDMLATYYVLFHCYFFPNHSCDISMDYYGEYDSPNLMFLFRLSNMMFAADGRTEEEVQIERAVEGIVSRRNNNAAIGLIEGRFDPNGKVCLDTKKIITGNEVITAIINEDRNARNLLKSFVTRRMLESPWLNPTMVEAGIKARVSRLRNLDMC